MSDIKTIDQISRNEWAVYEWFDVSLVSDVEPRYVCGRARRPEDVISAGSQYDAHISLRREAGLPVQC